MRGALLVAMGALLGCGGGGEDDDGGSSSGFVRATMALTAGGAHALDTAAGVQRTDTLEDCEGTDGERFGAAVSWELGAPPATGSYQLSGVLGEWPKMAISFPKPSGGLRLSLVTNGTVEITESGGGTIAGTFGGIQLMPNDADDAVTGVEDGSFRCDGL